MSSSLRLHGPHCPWNSPGQNTGVGNISLLQGIVPTQVLNPGLPHCRQILYQLSYRLRPRILEWVAHPFSRRSSQPSNQIRVFCIAGRFFTCWATREAQFCLCAVLRRSVVSDPCDPIDCSPPGSFVHGILQARILEWVTISLSRDSAYRVDFFFLVDEKLRLRDTNQFT